VEVPEHRELVGAEAPFPALLPQTPVEPDDGTAEAGCFGEVIHGWIVREYLLSCVSERLYCA
jgi:hypothetical protein